MDLFAGRNAPIFHACRQLGVDLLAPLDIELGWDILLDANFERMLHACWNGFVGGLWSAPPCREYSRLKLRQPGPKPLRTPDHPYGRLDLTASEQLRLQTQETIHSRGRDLLTAVHCKGGLVGWETPPTAMTLLLKENTEMLRDWNATCSHVAACNWGMDFAKSWLMCANDVEVASLASWCSCSTRHPSFAGVRTSTGGFLSAETAEYPAPLALALAQIMTKRCTFSKQTLHWSHQFSRHPIPRRSVFVNDGGGIPSTADWSTNSSKDVFHDLRQRILDYGKSTGLMAQVVQQLRQQSAEEPLTSAQLNPLKQILHDWALTQGLVLDWSIAPFQKFRLSILDQLSQFLNDPDRELHHHLQHGVPTGVLDPIPPGHIWPAKPTSTTEEVPDLQSFCSNWTGAHEDPDLTQSLIDEEINQGWVEELHGGLAEAKRRWTSIAVGKLNVVHADGKKPRLVLDSSCCNVNQRCTLPETMVLPTVDDVRATIDTTDCGSLWSGLSLDIKAAHKQIRLKEADRGVVMFSFNSRYFCYRVAHFGGRFSAYWWSRLGAFLLRLLHRFLAAPHKAWLYVDDLMLWTLRSHLEEVSWYTVVFLMLLGTPISWNKAQIGQHITWIGWHFNLDHYSVHLMDNKVDRLRSLLQSMISADSVSRKQLEQLLGVLIWFTAIAKHLRPHLAVLYKNLYSPPATLFSIPAASWPAFVHILDSSATIVKQHPHFSLPLQGRVVDVGHLTVRDKQDVPITPKTSKLQWVRIAVPHQAHLSLTRETIKKLQWFLTILQRQVHVYPLAQPSPCILRAAADAFAEGNSFGIGGWIITSQNIAWFSELFTMQELRVWKPQLTKDAQKYISGFEILSQLALLIMASEHFSWKHMQISVPTSSDNTSAESSINRQLSTKEPSATFLQLISQWALQRNIALSVTHIAGRDNTWADDLSRNKLHQWKAYPRFRLTLETIFSIGRVVQLFPPGNHPPWLQVLENILAFARPLPCSRHS